MISLFKMMWSVYDTEKRKKHCERKLEEEQKVLDARIAKETNAKLESLMQSDEINEKPSEDHNCFKRSGVITKIDPHFEIDCSLVFDHSVAGKFENQLTIGCTVEYIAYKSKNDHLPQVIKIEDILVEAWNAEDLTNEKELEEKIETLQMDETSTKYFNTGNRSVLGLVIERSNNTVLVETEYKPITLNLNEIKIAFVPQEGDRVVISCITQLDELFVDQRGEILRVESIQAARTCTQECTVTRLENEWAVLNNDIYLAFDMLPTTCPKRLSVGDIISADLIECERGNYNWRCMNYKLISMIPPSPIIGEDNDDTVNENPTKKLQVLVSKDVTLIYTKTGEKKTCTLTMSNQADYPMMVHAITLSSNNENSIVQLIDPSPENTKFSLAIGEKRVLRFEATPSSYGETRETILFEIENFQIKRSFAILVYENEALAQTARKNLANGKLYSNRICNAHRNASNAYRKKQYAYQVWSKKGEILPGVTLGVQRRFVPVHIDVFNVPEELRKNYLGSTTRVQQLKVIETIYPFLSEELHTDNYVQRFRALLHLEEIEYFINFRKYDRKRAHFTREGEYLSLYVENLAEQRPSLVIGDTVRASSPWNETDLMRYDGSVHKVLHDHLLIKFNDVFHSKYNGEDYCLEFYFSRFPFRKQHYAIRNITRSKSIVKRMLFPEIVHVRDRPQLALCPEEECDNDASENNTATENENANKEVPYRIDLKSLKWYNKSLNEVQKRAVYHILRGEAELMPYVVFGPPGTGKTITLIETILQLVHLVPDSRILVGTPSNSAADLMVLRLINSKVLQPGDFVRLVSHNSVERETIPQELLPYCATPDFGTEGTHGDSMVITNSGLKLQCSMSSLGRHRITIGTCSTLGNFIPMGFPPGHFTHAIIDECGQCTEPEVMVPISMLFTTPQPNKWQERQRSYCVDDDRQQQLNRCQIILAGDPQQLSAVVINMSNDHALSTSYLERIMKLMPYRKDLKRFPETNGYDPRIITKLLYNYRGLPSILKIYNDLFYDGELEACLHPEESREAEILKELSPLLPESQKRSMAHGVFFYGMRSENKQITDSPSWFNPIEARNVYLMAISLYRQNIQPEQIGIITPYALQAKHIRSLFITADIGMPKVGTVEEFQGQERDIILISTVRSTKNLLETDIRFALGFVRSTKRMNVAISRSRLLTFVFGNPHLLCLDKYWRAFIQYCVDNDSYLGCDLPTSFKYRPNNV